MIEFSSKKIKITLDNTLIKKHFNLDKDLDCFVVLSSNNEKFGDALSNKILDSIIDRISLDNTYDDFSLFLENINGFIKTWKQESDEDLKINIAISLLNKNTFYFSTIGTASYYLINSSGDVIEITDHKELKKQFSYVSQGKIAGNDIVVSSNIRLFNYLSKSDFLHSLKVSQFDGFTKNLKQILQNEEVKSNVCITALRNNNHPKHVSVLNHKYVITAQQYTMKMLDNPLTKKIIALSMITKDKLIAQSHIVKNILIGSAILLCLFVLYSIISSLLSTATQSSDKSDAKLQLTLAIEHIQTANKNIANPDIFDENIGLAENIVKDIKDSQLYINDVNKILGDISTLKKQYNGIETFVENSDNLVYPNKNNGAISVINNDGKLFIIGEKSIIGPIIAGQNPKEFVFDKLESDEIFLDATLLGSDIILLTNFSKVVNFTKNAYFSFQDVKDQVTWDKSDSIHSFGNNNIYFISEDKKQILKHTKNVTGFNAGNTYLKEEDAKVIGKIRSIGIDGGIYIMKDDLSIVKLLASPQYQIQSIILNNLPKNYNYQSGKIDIKTASNLKYVYVLLNEKIWIFKPDTLRYQDTKSLTYLGQIESQNEAIEDFYVKNDGEVYIINNTGLYRMKFEENEGRIILR